jgi:hypothetical protein
MERGIILVMALGLVITFAHVGFSQVGTPGEAGIPGPTVAQATTSTAIVAAIDFEHRIATIKLPDGTTTTFKAGPEASGFDQLKVGDLVLVRN